ncbi:hypothetical protein WISP_106518 [Willisornis vidua]|uniref:Retroviral nucleocapsid Gag protein p24 C-terminal domain-containing protein n=1 Tax=Willisornis vidua TaxID=1566151 RepID=A0ABQ9D1S4_9PASS|nr:hypothetical protein WISP_106518 [Willisornis vidua]
MGIALSRVQHLELDLKPHEVPMGPLAELFQIPLDGILSFRTHITPRICLWFVINRLAFLVCNVLPYKLKILVIYAKKAVTEYGLSSAYALGVIGALLQAFTFTPNDLKDLARTLLNNMEITMFLDTRHANVRKYAHETAGSTNRTVPDTIEMLFGIGKWAFNAEQVKIDPQDLLTTKNLAFKALQTIAEASQVTPPFTSVFQEPDEPFMRFAERLKEAIARETKEKHVQDIIFKQIAISNAKAQCQPVLRALKIQRP